MENLNFGEFLEELGDAVITAPEKFARWYFSPKSGADWMMQVLLTTFALAIFIGVVLDIIYAVR